MIVGCYTIDLYCDGGGDGYNCPNGREFESIRCGSSCYDSYAGTNERDCLAQARKMGWTFKENNTKAFCRYCSRGLKK